MALLDLLANNVVDLYSVVARVGMKVKEVCDVKHRFQVGGIKVDFHFTFPCIHVCEYTSAEDWKRGLSRQRFKAGFFYGFVWSHWLSYWSRAYSKMNSQTVSITTQTPRLAIYRLAV